MKSELVTINNKDRLGMATKSPGSRRRYNDKILGHQERADAYNTEFERMMKSVQNIRTQPQTQGPEGQPVTLMRYIIYSWDTM